MQIGDYKVTKLDRRYTGHEQYAYMAEPYFDRYVVGSRMQKAQLFDQMRQWCWNQWGPGTELHLARFLDKSDPWGWETEHSKLRIYLKTDNELALFAVAFAGG
jgi:hypothetical protein